MFVLCWTSKRILYDCRSIHWEWANIICKGLLPNLQYSWFHLNFHREFRILFFLNGACICLHFRSANSSIMLKYKSFISDTHLPRPCKMPPSRSCKSTGYPMERQICQYSSLHLRLPIFGLHICFQIEMGPLWIFIC